MKNIYLLTLILFAGIVVGNAQISEKEIVMSLGAQNGFEMSVMDDDVAKVEKLWKDFAKSYGKFKKNRKSGELYGEQIKIEKINGKEPLDLYVRVNKDGKSCKVQFWVDLGDRFLSSENHPDAYSGTMEVLTDFDLETQRILIGEELNNEEKELANFEKEMKQLKKENDRYHREIEKAKASIEKNETNIDENLKAQEEKQDAIETQKKRVQEIADKLDKVGKKN